MMTRQLQEQTVGPIEYENAEAPPGGCTQYRGGYHTIGKDR